MPESFLAKWERVIKSGPGLYDRLVSCDPKIERGRVWCRACGATQNVDPAHCFRHGWPTCCGATMSLDAPEERAARDPSP